MNAINNYPQQEEKIITPDYEMEQEYELQELKLYNGKKVTTENVLNMLREEDTEGGDMTDDEVAVIKRVSRQDYEGAEEDLQYLTEKLQEETKIGYLYPSANWQTVYDILSQGNWYYQE